MCPSTAYKPHENPFRAAAQSSGWCWSKIDGSAGSFQGGPKHGAFATVGWSLPVLIAAIDPSAEAKLDQLNGAVTAGRYLRQHEGAGRARYAETTIPAPAAASSGIGEYAVTRIQRLAAPANPARLSARVMAAEATAPGRTIASVRITAQQAYQQALVLTHNPSDYLPIRAYWTAGPTSYRSSGTGILTPVQVRNPLSVWQSGET